MPTVWAQFGTREETERAIGRLEFAGFRREQIDRIEGADGSFRVGIYVDYRDAPQVDDILSDTGAPTRTDLVTSLVIFGTTALAGILLAYLLPKQRIG